MKSLAEKIENWIDKLQKNPTRETICEILEKVPFMLNHQFGCDCLERAMHYYETQKDRRVDPRIWTFLEAKRKSLRVGGCEEIPFGFELTRDLYKKNSYGINRAVAYLYKGSEQKPGVFVFYWSCYSEKCLSWCCRCLTWLLQTYLWAGPRIPSLLLQGEIQEPEDISVRAI